MNNSRNSYVETWKALEYFLKQFIFLFLLAKIILYKFYARVELCMFENAWGWVRRYGGRWVKGGKFDGLGSGFEGSSLVFLEIFCDWESSSRN